MKVDKISISLEAELGDEVRAAALKSGMGVSSWLAEAAAAKLRAVDVRPVDEQLAREAGILIARAGTSDPIDATVVLVAEPGDRILTSDPRDLKRLAAAARKRVAIIAC